MKLVHEIIEENEGKLFMFKDPRLGLIHEDDLDPIMAIYIIECKVKNVTNYDKETLLVEIL